MEIKKIETNYKRKMFFHSSNVSFKKYTEKLENQIIEGNSIVILMNKNFCIDDMKFAELFEEMKNIFENNK